LIESSTALEKVPDSEVAFLLQRAKSRIARQEAVRQLNIEEITRGAAEELRDVKDDEIADQPVDEEWIARFFQTAQDISNEVMQRLWSRILAGEVKRPGSFSARCLDAIRNLSREEAELFEQCLPFVFDNQGLLVPRLIEKHINLSVGHMLASALTTVDPGALT
jgi:hypothetical protein